MSGIPDLSALGNGAPPQMIPPWVIALSGQIQVRRMDSMRILEVVHPSGVIAAQITLDAISAAQIARQLSSPADQQVDL